MQHTACPNGGLALLQRDWLVRESVIDATVTVLSC
jgi:hypothetical protein